MTAVKLHQQVDKANFRHNATLKPSPRGRRTSAEIVASINAQDVAEWRISVADDLLSLPLGNEII